MKKFTTSLIIIFALSIFNYNSVYAASTGGESKYNTSFYKQGKKLVLKAKKLQKKIKKKKHKKYIINHKIIIIKT